MSINKTPKIIKQKANKIYKHKKLNDANFSDFTLNDYQVFLHIISKINYGPNFQPEQLEREYLLSAQEFAKVFNIALSNCYGILKKAANKLMKTDIKIERPDLNEVWQINICSRAKYNEKQGNITIKFTDDIMPYLLAQVKQRFVLYNLKEISNFDSFYTTRLYELIQEFKDTGWLIKSVEQLREIFAVSNKLKAYKDFKVITFAHACKEINDNYDLNLRFEELKEKRKVVAVKFFFKPTK